jgi:subtilisin family serine protease
MQPVGLLAVLLCWAAGAGAAHGQVTLPQVQLPQVPQVPLPVDLDVEGTLSAAGRLEAERLLDLRRVRLRSLVRRYRDVLEADPNGAPILRSEVLALAPSDAALARARDAGFTIRRQRSLQGLDATLVVLQAPSGLSTRRALARLRKLDPQGAYDYNHVYEPTGTVGAAEATTAPREQASPAAPAARIRIGLIDAGVDATHEVFRGVSLHQTGCGDTPVPSPHGTAVASLLAGQASGFAGAAPRAELHVVDVYCGAPGGGAADSLADALASMVRGRVPVVNVSLVGPPNRTLETVVRLVIARGHVVVAAVGNDGPAAPPLYPAAYPGVVAVTGIDARRRALLEACRGKHVDFAAPGSDMRAAAPGNGYSTVRGTSFAAPIVAGLLAAHVLDPDRARAEQALAGLVTLAVDLGKRGRDPVFGDGLVGESVRN